MTHKNTQGVSSITAPMHQTLCVSVAAVLYLFDLIQNFLRSPICQAEDKEGQDSAPADKYQDKR